MPVLITHPTGNEFFRAAAKGFYAAGSLQSVYTAIASFPGSLLYRLGGFKAFSDIRRRAIDSEFKKFVHIHPGREAARLLAGKAGIKKLVQHETGVLSVDNVYRGLDKYVAKKLIAEKRRGVSVVYAYEDGACYTFQKAKELGIRCAYDLPIGYWRQMHEILAAESELNPGWAVTLEALKDSKEKLSRKDREIELADTIFVASSFTANTLQQYPGNLPPVRVIPYGFPPATGKAYNRHSKIKLLFVGGLSQRKGISYLFKALESLESNIELTVVGRLPQVGCEPLNLELGKHRHISSLPHSKILELMRAHDVLVFPSLFEGFGQVITEAMAQGTPVITTERTAGPDLIKHGENGWLVQAGSAEVIKNVLEEIIRTPGIIAATGAQALETAKKRPWRVYGEELAEAVGRMENK